MEKDAQHHVIILFDGVCNVCNASVQFLIRRDKQDYFRFASLQSATGRQYRALYPVIDMDSVVVIENDQVYTKSTAALRVLPYLRGGWFLLAPLRYIPRFVRDGVYSWFARNRYRWFGRRQHCMVPTPDVQRKFLEG